MVESRSNSHDAYFRHVMARPENAASELRAVLPVEITSRIDWSGLQLQSGSFVTPELRSRYSDMLFRTRINGHPAYIYLLIEHQSTSDQLMPFRMLEYIVAIWRRHLEQDRHRRKRDGATGEKSCALPAVIPLVVHNSSKGSAWSAPTELIDLIDLDPASRPALAPYLPRLRFLLDDITAADLASLRARDLTPPTRILLILQKLAPHDHLLEEAMLDMLDDLRAVENGPDPDGDLVAMIRYILTVSDVAEASLASVFEQLGPRAKEALMTTAERIEARGRAEGEARGRAELLIELMTAKFGSLPDATIDRVRRADPADVSRWSSRLLKVETADEMFAG